MQRSRIRCWRKIKIHNSTNQFNTGIISIISLSKNIYSIDECFLIYDQYFF